SRALVTVTASVTGMVLLAASDPAEAGKGIRPTTATYRVDPVVREHSGQSQVYPAPSFTSQWCRTIHCARPGGKVRDHRSKGSAASPGTPSPGRTQRAGLILAGRRVRSPGYLKTERIPSFTVVPACVSLTWTDCIKRSSVC